MTTTRYTLDPDATSGGSARLLAVALDGETAGRLRSASTVEARGMERCHSAVAALERAGDERFDVIACRYPLPDLLMREFVTRLRAEDSASHAAPLILFAIPEMMTEARRAVQRGPSCAVSREAPVGVLDTAVVAMLRAARPTSRGTVHVWIESPHAPHEVSGDVLHVSSSDLLVGSDQHLPIASRGRFALRLDHVPVEVRGECEVVREVRPTRGAAAGFALRMLQFEDDGGQHLAALLRA